MKSLFAIIIAGTLLTSCNGMGRDSDDRGTAPGNDTMRMQTHGLDVHENTRVGNEIGTHPDSTVTDPENLVDSTMLK